MPNILTRSDRVRRPTTPHRLHVIAFRGRNTDGDEASATWKEAVNTAWEQELGAVPGFRVRFVVTEAQGRSGRVPLVLQYSANGGPWTDATTSPLSALNFGSSIPDGGDTTQQLSTGAFVTPNAGLGASGGAVGETASYVGGGKVELEWALWLRPGFIDPGEPMGMRVRELWGGAIPWHEVSPEFYRTGAPPSGGGRDPNQDA